MTTATPKPEMFDNATLQVFRWGGLAGVPAAVGAFLIGLPPFAFLLFWGGLGVFTACSLVLSRRKAARRLP